MSFSNLVNTTDFSQVNLETEKFLFANALTEFSDVVNSTVKQTYSDWEDAEEDDQNSSRRQRCKICHQFKYTRDDVCSLSQKQRQAYQHKCTEVTCKNYMLCPTKWLKVSDHLYNH